MGIIWFILLVQMHQYAQVVYICVAIAKWLIFTSIVLCVLDSDRHMELL
jgi:hypothetical protein